MPTYHHTSEFSHYSYHYLQIAEGVHASKVGHRATQVVVGQGPGSKLL